jgi:hypothetical protein
MPPIFNTTEVTSLPSLLTSAQSVAPYFQLVVVAIFIVAFVSLKRFTNEYAVPAALFITSLSALLFWLLQLLQDAFFYGAVVGLAATLLMLYYKRA